ncbi:MAG: efflux RND transporter periplasmic adaptor subunit [Deltaproteobacteria bacterium]|nr:efflux RND transporter periplasmic adaptor subunit [Deltaproteobacteria bacterium]MBW2444492.1 efflux RND transporter periplasmic adaptor subunit [Deltaproteobacteria bacterium]
MRPSSATHLLLSLALLGCGGEEAAEVSVVRPIKILEIGSASGTGTSEFPGEVAATRTAQLAFEVSGRIIEFPVTEGQILAKGDLVARLDPRDFEADIAKGRAQLENARTELKRFKYLYEQDVASKQTYENRLRNFEVAEAEFAQIAKAGEDAELRAPFHGVVARKLVDDFANVQSKQEVVLFQDESEFEIVVSISEQDFARGRSKFDLAERSRILKPRVVLTALPDLTFPARITEVSTAADPTTRTFQVTLAFGAPEGVNVRSGMTAKVIVNSDAAILALAPRVPATAVLSDENGQPILWRVDPETMTVSAVQVKLGEPRGTEIEVTSGLKSGNWVAVSGVHHLHEGLAVRRWEP